MACKHTFVASYRSFKKLVDTWWDSLYIYENIRRLCIIVSRVKKDGEVFKRRIQCMSVDMRRMWEHKKILYVWRGDSSPAQEEDYPKKIKYTWGKARTSTAKILYIVVGPDSSWHKRKSPQRQIGTCDGYAMRIWGNVGHQSKIFHSLYFYHYLFQHLRH